VIDKNSKINLSCYLW